MLDTLREFFSDISIIDFLYLVITVLSLIECYRKGFVLSILSMAKWILAYVITLILFPKVKPYFTDIIDNEYVLDVGLGVAIFIIVIFLVLMINRGISKAIRYTGIGSLDTVFGFFFGFIRAYIIFVCIFSGVHIVKFKFVSLDASNQLLATLFPSPIHSNFCFDKCPLFSSMVKISDIT